jgi:molybdopterin-biosynthesis enzyme MoeA-like protein
MKEPESMKKIVDKKLKSKSTRALEKKIADTNFKFQQEQEEAIGKQLNDLQEKCPYINLIKKYRKQLMKKQEQINDHFGVAEFIEKLMEEERTGIKKEIAIKKEVMISNRTALLTLKRN